MSHAAPLAQAGFPLPALDYDFLAPGRIVFGWGRRREIGTLAATLGRRAFVVVGSQTLEKSGVIDEILQALRAGGVDAIRLAWMPVREPEVSDVDLLASILRKASPRDGGFVIGLGGGSAVDLAKAAAAMATNRESSTVADYLEGVGSGLKIVNPPLPMLALPTTAGTGSEATKNAVISGYHPPFKKSLRSDMMVPRAVLIDPELTVSVPAPVTAHTGMDAITQLIESYISRRAKPLPRALCLQGIQVAIPALREAVRNGSCRWAREAMSHAALLSGLALANSGLGVAHGVAAALGAECKISHGLACAVMLPAALKANRQVSEVELAALARVACPELLNGAPDNGAAADALLRCIESLTTELGIPSRLRNLGVCQEQIPALVAASHGNSLTGNPREVTDQELATILNAMW